MTNGELRRWVKNPTRSNETLREACRGLSLPADGNAKQLRAQLDEYLEKQPQDKEAAWNPPQMVPQASTAQSTPARQQPAKASATAKSTAVVPPRRNHGWLRLVLALVVLLAAFAAGAYVTGWRPALRVPNLGQMIATAGIGANGLASKAEATAVALLQSNSDPRVRVLETRIAGLEGQLVVASLTVVTRATALPQAAEAQAETASVPMASGACPPAEQLGPWAPDSDGRGETFEISAARGWVHTSLWWPNGNTPWGNQEISTTLQPGTSITVLNGSGTAWDYPGECPVEEVQRQVAAYRQERGKWTRFYGAVELDELLSLGLVEIRLPLVFAGTTSVTPQPTAIAPTVAPTATTAPVEPTATTPAEVSCTAIASSHQPVVDQVWELDNADSVVIVHFWTNQPGHDQSERKLLLDHQTVGLLGGGSTWTFPATCQQVARDQFQADPMPEVSLDALRQEGLAK